MTGKSNLQELRVKYYKEDCNCDWCVSHRRTVNATLKDLEDLWKNGKVIFSVNQWDGIRQLLEVKKEAD